MHSLLPALLRRGIASVLTLALSPAPHAQEPPANPPAAQVDPDALAAQASRLNNLAARDVQPWHLKASFQLFDDQGNASGDGTWEEFWAGPQRYKRIVSGKDFSETLYGSAQGDLQTNAHGDLPFDLSSAQRDLLNPFPEILGAQKTDITAKEVEMGALKLTCLTFVSFMSIATRCVGHSEPILRVSSYPSSSVKVLRNRMLRFADRVVPGDLKIVRDGKTMLTMHVDTMESLADPDDALFTAPADAVRIPVTVQVAQAVTQSMLEYRVIPDYPLAAKNADMEGTVVLQAIIGKDGHPRDLKVISGAKVFQGPSIQAVQQWRYRPYLLNGQPVEMMTTITVTFNRH